MQIENQAGCVKNMFDEQQISGLLKLFSSKKLVDTGGNGGGTKTVGIHQKAPLFPLFEKTFMTPLRNYFNENLKLVFAMYADCRIPFDIHDDCQEHIEQKLPGKPWLSCLVPLSVDNDVDKTHYASTVVFNETEHTVEKDNNCVHLYEEKFSHVTIDRLKGVTIKEEYNWHRGDLVWWYSPLMHTSCHFKKFKSKQMLVCHTYIL